MGGIGSDRLAGDRCVGGCLPAKMPLPHVVILAQGTSNLLPPSCPSYTSLESAGPVALDLPRSLAYSAVESACHSSGPLPGGTSPRSCTTQVSFHRSRSAPSHSAIFHGPARGWPSRCACRHRLLYRGPRLFRSLGDRGIIRRFAPTLESPKIRPLCICIGPLSEIPEKKKSVHA